MGKQDNEKIKVLDCKKKDNKYMHKDFHSALCYSIKYLEDNFGQDSVDEYLTQVARTYFQPLIDKLKKEGLPALQKHYNHVFSAEKGQFSIELNDNKMTLRVGQCPAISHLKEKNMYFTKSFCKTTVVVNETICKDADFNFKCEYDPDKGKCVQQFWKENK